MLVAIALDANNCIYLVAYAIVERENDITWRWFIQQLDEDCEYQWMDFYINHNKIWDLSGIPFAHALATTIDRMGDPWEVLAWVL